MQRVEIEDKILGIFFFSINHGIQNRLSLLYYTISNKARYRIFLMYNIKNMTML